MDNYGDLIQHMDTCCNIYMCEDGAKVSNGICGDMLNYTDNAFIYLIAYRERIDSVKLAYIAADTIETVNAILDELKDEFPPNIKFIILGYYHEYPILSGGDYTS